MRTFYNCNNQYIVDIVEFDPDDEIYKDDMCPICMRRAIKWLSRKDKE